MKTLLITEVFPPQTGGSGRWFWELYRRLPRDYVSIAASQHLRAHVFDQSHDLPLSRLPLTFSQWGLTSWRGLENYVQAVHKLRRLVKRDHIEMLHCGKCLPEGLLAWMLCSGRGLSYIVYTHGEELTLANTSRELRWLTKRVLHGASRIIANSRHTQRLLERDWAIPPERSVVMYPGVETMRFVPAEPDPTLRAQLGWYDRPVILTVGALQKRKGQDMLIRALPTIIKRIPNVLYSIVGEGWERAYLEALVDDYDVAAHVQFCGVPDDDELVQRYQQCDLFALPNRQVGPDIEGFGIVLLEAQSCGKPVIAGRSGGTAETMRPSDTGYLVNCESPAELAAVTSDLLRDDQRLSRMSEAAREWAVSTFDWSVVVDQAMDLLFEMCPDQGSGAHTRSC